jgi:hypothetical protein
VAGHDPRQGSRCLHGHGQSTQRDPMLKQGTPALSGAKHKNMKHLKSKFCVKLKFYRRRETVAENEDQQWKKNEKHDRTKKVGSLVSVLSYALSWHLMKVT